MEAPIDYQLAAAIHNLYLEMKDGYYGQLDDTPLHVVDAAIGLAKRRRELHETAVAQDKQQARRDADQAAARATMVTQPDGSITFTIPGEL